MATKPDKEKTSKKAGIPKATGIKKTAGKPKKAVEEDDDLNLEEDEAGSKTGKKSMSGKNKTGDDFESEDDLNFEEEEGPNMKKVKQMKIGIRILMSLICRNHLKSQPLKRVQKKTKMIIKLMMSLKTYSAPGHLLPENIMRMMIINML